MSTPRRPAPRSSGAPMTAIFECRMAALKLRRARSARERNHVADVFHAGEIHHHPLQTQAKARVWRRAVASQIQIPLIVLQIESLGADLFGKHVVPLLALAA